MFGCKTNVHVPKGARKQKLASRSKSWNFVGIYNSLYKIWDPAVQGLIASKHATMDEAMFSTAQVVNSSDPFLEMDNTIEVTQYLGSNDEAVVKNKTWLRCAEGTNTVNKK